MLLPTLITQLAYSSVENLDAIASRPTLTPRESGGVVFVRDGQTNLKGKALARPGAAAHVIIRRLLAGRPVSGRILMNEHCLMRNTAMSAIDRLEKHGFITPESAGSGRMRQEQTYQLTEEFIEAYKPIENLQLF